MAYVSYSGCTLLTPNDILNSQQSVRSSGKSPITNTGVIPIEESGTAPIDRKMFLVKVRFVSRQVTVDVTLGAKVLYVLSLYGALMGLESEITT